MVCADYVDDIAALIAQCVFPSGALFLVEMLPQHVVVGSSERKNLLRFANFDASIPFAMFAAYTSGRIFHPDFELRWEKQGDRTQVIYIGMEEYRPPVSMDVHHLDLKENDSLKYYYLFGERLRPEHLERIGVPHEEREYAFAEVRIPRLLLYPAPQGARRVRLAVREYVQEVTEKVELYRFHSLEAAE